jgi:hypothetical protein
MRTILWGSSMGLLKHEVPCSMCIICCPSLEPPPPRPGTLPPAGLRKRSMEDKLVVVGRPSGAGYDGGGADSNPGVHSANAEDDDAVSEESRMSLDSDGGEGCGVDGEPPLWGADSCAEPEVFGADFVRSLVIQGKVWLDNTFLLHIVAIINIIFQTVLPPLLTCQREFSATVTRALAKGVPMESIRFLLCKMFSLTYKPQGMAETSASTPAASSGTQASSQIGHKRTKKGAHLSVGVPL